MDYRQPRSISQTFGCIVLKNANKTTPHIAAQKKEHVSNHPALCAFYSLALISRGVAPGCHTVALSGL
jgi:hypothetical protein